jgi:hypothetical protein
MCPGLFPATLKPAATQVKKSSNIQKSYDCENKIGFEYIF